MQARPGVAEANVRALAAPLLGPFDRTAVLYASSPFQLCARWPTAPAEPLLPDGPFPAVPTLVLAGEDDLRTPLEGARRVAARIPGAILVSAPETGHSVLSGFPRRCGLRAAEDFFAGRPVRPCVARRRTFPPLPPFPRSLAQVDAQPQVGGKRGRTITAVGLTLADALDQLVSASMFAGFEQEVLQAGGLREGYVRADEERLELHGVAFVPRVRVRGRITFGRRPHGALRVSGRAAARGRLVFHRDGSVTGRLGGRRVRVTGGALRARRAQPARGGLSRVMRRLAGWPPDVPARIPGAAIQPVLDDAG
jgi:hypothetical protein